MSLFEGMAIAGFAVGQQQQLESILEFEGNSPGVIAKQRTLDLCVTVLEREVVVTARGHEDIAGLAAHPDPAHRVLDQRPQPTQQVGDAVDAPLGAARGQRRLGRRHYSPGTASTSSTSVSTSTATIGEPPLGRRPSK